MYWVCACHGRKPGVLAKNGDWVGGRWGSIGAAPGEGWTMRWWGRPHAVGAEEGRGIRVREWGPQLQIPETLFHLSRLNHSVMAPCGG
jgi:hypothetical protein